ncbi:MAG: tripartite tricarboxylate transporter TctB family protein [Pseudorhodobacter sp.]
MTNLPRNNRAVGVVLFTASTALFIYLWLMPWTHREMRDGFILGFFPLLGAIALMVCAAVMVFDPLRHEVPEDLETTRWSDVGLAAIMLIGIGCYSMLMREWGFILVTPVFLILYMYWMGMRPLVLIVFYGIVLPIIIQILFGILGVSLPQGPLAGLF